MAGIFGSGALAFAAIQRNLPKIARWQKATWIVSVGALGGYAGIHFAGPNCLKKLVLLPDSKLADEARRIVLERRSSIPNAESLIRNFPIRKFEEDIEEPRKFSSFAPDGSLAEGKPSTADEDSKPAETSKAHNRMHARHSERQNRWTEDFHRNPHPRHGQTKPDASNATPEQQQKFRPDQFDPYQGVTQEAKESAWFDQDGSKTSQKTNQYGDPV
ncbi:hypothetical protein GUITHDRAFT_164346 [Guillardia theta CCMP2712]|uniref:Uncharacterized protein n=2 Tax=Guillardia theta TaxID=55529 RepID=L1IZG9_GUITC|nr:hypothetical protein GUITHDRAFT_164346 [Guillardia theta CCMP2712]EKX41646.1 hypothetical protein GUITHDRAFT_164346 [Guillardia theta CCMP2712]|eukprot:XP_005828626.1 hypothetical protein GUITHDRAFT_164346 [Guillardia theta CCMP2712]